MRVHPRYRFRKMGVPSDRMKRGRPLSSTRRFVEDCIAIDVRTLPRLSPAVRQLYGSDLAPLDVTLTWGDGGRMTLRLFTTATRPTYGGERTWFVCPGCRRRCAKLYAIRRGDEFACRVCHRLVYGLQYWKDPGLAYVYRWIFHPPSNTASAIRQRARREERGTCCVLGSA